MTARNRNLADALLDAHVQFVLDQLGGAALPALLETELDALLAGAAKLTLNAVMDRQTIKDTIQVFAIEMELEGGVPELVGDIARSLYAHEIHDRTPLSGVLTDKVFTEMLDKALEMKSLRTSMVHALTSSPQYLAFASDLVYQGIKGYLAESPLTRNIPGAKSMMKLGKAVMSKASPGLENSVEESLKKYIRHSVKNTARASERILQKNMDEGVIRAALLEFWDRIKDTPVAALRRDITSRDVEDAFVIGYEMWRELRRTEIYSALINAGVDSFFDKYGDSTLRELLGEIGISRELMLGEAMRYAPPVLKVLQRKKLLEPLIRRNLERFYRSEAAAAVLAPART